MVATVQNTIKFSPSGMNNEASFPIKVSNIGEAFACRASGYHLLDSSLFQIFLFLFPEGGKILAEFSNSIELGKLGQKHMFLQLSQTFSNFLPHLMLPPSLTNMTALTENIFKVYRSTLLSL
ncbi:hypothetical protein AT2G13275 [Arabidopsis thaliana]|uniref:Uncharacterized protein n=1 Tax=Arabidopsis thaliana TaxID=3702 RepID=A0A1P8AX52_ARATH|nr:uncharacterized protein AT2G13275 [Arabidopsis thaliana]ANM61213.1 hypothetical protein AT2G13275 [Arabidopsis thaliana]|eukprot:NP_001323443.1 hypothetical protein AT2G13275 [Arabidopsis thaliana]